MRSLLFILSLGSLIIISGCSRNYEFREENVNVKKTVEVKKENGAFKLYRNGEPYYIQGVGGSQFVKQAGEAGANSIRTWSSFNAQQILDSAQKYGLTVTLGIDLGRPRLGFDYNDKAQTEKQLKWVKEEVMKYKDHPALLMWGIGNEMNGEYGDKMNLWKGVNEVAELIHTTDPNHPTSTMIFPRKTTIFYIKQFCPSIDIISFNTFGALYDLRSTLESTFTSWDGAYVVSEWGPKGHWETDSTNWSVPIEQTSTEKAEFIKKNYSYIIGNKDKCLGSYVMFWGSKQERTPTWFSLFSEKGEKTETVDLMRYLWKGTWPENRVPSVSRLTIDNKGPKKNVVLAVSKSEKHVAEISTKDPENDSLSYYWQMLRESTEILYGGDKENFPEEIRDASFVSKGNKFEFIAPNEEGAYRLFVYVLDGKKNIATANIPFYVVFP